MIFFDCYMLEGAIRIILLLYHMYADNPSWDVTVENP